MIKIYESPVRTDDNGMVINPGPDAVVLGGTEFRAPACTCAMPDGQCGRHAYAMA